MNLIVRAFVCGVLSLFINFSISAANIAILESQSNHPLQKMDESWQERAQLMGHTADIFEQESLDDITSFDNYEVVIISSGLIDLPSNRRTTLLQLVQNGKSLYIQSEYLLTHPGNETFEYIISSFGHSFNWLGESSGNISPLSVNGILAYNYVEEDEITYFWYGTYGEGDNSVTPFLTNNGLHYGFSFCADDLDAGLVITTSDQDWVRVEHSLDLMDNILYYLTAETGVSDPEVIISETTNDPCDGNAFEAIVTTGATGYWLQWTINGLPVSGANSTIFESSNLAEGDVVECVLQKPVNCSLYEHISNPILIGPIIPLVEPTFTITANNTQFCIGQEIIFTTNLEDTIGVSNLIFQWYINGQIVIGAISDQFSTSELENEDLISCVLTYDTQCENNNQVISNDIEVGVMGIVNPTINITASQTTICLGDEITFTVAGASWGQDFELQWQVDGEDVGDGSMIFISSDLTDGQQVTCILTSSMECAEPQIVTATPVQITIETPPVATLQITASETEICLGTVVEFSASGINWGSDPVFEWYINGNPIGYNMVSFMSTTLLDGQVITCSITNTDACSNNTPVISNEVAISVLDPVTPSLLISTNQSQACPGVEINFIAEATNDGENPSFEWLINGQIVTTGGATFSSNQFNNGDIVTCQLTSDAPCITTNNVLSNPIEINISQPILEVLISEDEHCGQSNGFATVVVNGGQSPYSFEWSDGSIGSQINNVGAGNYGVTVSDANDCTDALEVIINGHDPVEVDSVHILHVDCEGFNGSATITMVNPQNTYFYEWINEDGMAIGGEASNNELSVGTYTVEISDEFGCFTTTEIVIESSEVPTIEMDTSHWITFGSSVDLNPYLIGSANMTYEWTPATGLSCSDCPNPVASPEVNTRYTLTVTNDNGCTASQTIDIYLIPDHQVYIPNAFSPNGDGNNDYFTVYAGDNVHHIKTLQVFDRWGNALFAKSDIIIGKESDGWDGSSMGKKLQQGVYVYYVEVTFTDGVTKVFKGDITLF